jgi:CBS domain-containing protein
MRLISEGHRGRTMTHTDSNSALHKLAADLMSAPAIVAEETATIREVAELLLTKGVGAAPVVNASGEAIGIVSDGDLLFRVRDDGRRAWWLGMLVEGAGADEAFAAHRDRPVREVMSAPLISIGPRTTAPEIAEALLTHQIKRLPVIEDARVIGIVTRTNLLAVVQSIPKVRLEEEPGAGLLSFLESMIGGSSLRGGLDRSRAAPAGLTPAADAAAPVSEAPRPLSASDFRARVSTFKAGTVDQKERERKAADLERRRQVKALVDIHINEHLWRDMMEHARLAASGGDTEYLLLQFPSDLCTDGGRKIDVAEAGWEETLRGEAADLYDRWRKELRPQGFGLSARIVSYVEGIIGDIGLFLTWGGA